MRGKKTHRHADYRGREAGWARPIAPPVWAVIEATLGPDRRLSDRERERIQDQIEEEKSFIDISRAAHVSAQDIIASLNDLATMPLAKVEAAYRRTSGYVQVEIADAMLRAGIRGDAIGSPSGEQIRTAAPAAATVVHGKSGRPSPWAAFDRRALALYGALGGEATIGDDRELTSGFVAFAMALYEAAGEARFSRAALRKRLRAITRG